jgi:hypothetical protein
MSLGNSDRGQGLLPPLQTVQYCAETMLMLRNQGDDMPELRPATMTRIYPKNSLVAIYRIPIAFAKRGKRFRVRLLNAAPGQVKAFGLENTETPFAVPPAGWYPE